MVSRPDSGAGAFDDGVGDQRRAVHNAVQLAGVHLRFLQQAGDAGDDRRAGILRRGQQLAGVHKVAARIVQHQIGEGAADINADACGTRGLRHAGYSSP